MLQENWMTVAMSGVDNFLSSLLCDKHLLFPDKLATVPRFLSRLITKQAISRIPCPEEPRAKRTLVFLPPFVPETRGSLSAYYKDAVCVFICLNVFECHL